MLASPFRFSFHLASQWMGLQPPLQSGFCSGVSVDTREEIQGTLFFALPGQRVDGHHFLENAAKKKASGAVVSLDYQGPSFGLPLFYSDNVLLSLQCFAKERLSKLKGRIIAITGSLGKTTVKDWVAHFLEGTYLVSKTPGNANSQIGLPLTILNQLSGKEAFFVFEMGMTKALHITNLIDIAPPDIALVTTVAPVHMDGFLGIEGIAEAKSELFLSPKTKLGFFPFEIFSKELFEKRGDFLKKTFSTKTSLADLFLEKKTDQMILHINKENKKINFPLLKVPGEHNFHNFLAAISLALSAKVPVEVLKEKVKTLQLPEKRLEKIEKRGIHFINDAYNASKFSTQAALLAMPQPQKKGRKIAVLGEMLGIGALSSQFHEEIGYFSLPLVDEMWCLGEACLPIVSVWKREKRNVFYFSNQKELIAALKSHLKKEDVVLVKGSRDKEMWKVIEEI